MPTVRTTCPSCEIVLIDACALTIRRRPDSVQSECCFICPDCIQAVVQPVSDKMVPVLIGAGCMVEDWGVSDSRFLHPSGGGITEAEIQQFISHLDNDDWFSGLLG